MAQQSAVEIVIALVLGGGLFGVAAWAMSESHARLDDPDDDRTLYLDQLPAKANLEGSCFQVTIYRQSGNVHAEDIITGPASSAIARLLATFRRAGIQAVHVPKNTRTELSIGRLYHDHRGRAEGKKVGRATIMQLANDPAQLAAPRLEPAVPVPRLIADFVPAEKPPFDGYHVGLRGESNYQPAIHKTLPGEPISLKPEPSNPHDPRAIQALNRRGDLIGYLPRDGWLTEMILDQGHEPVCTIASISRASYGLPYGVVIAVEK